MKAAADATYPSLFRPDRSCEGADSTAVLACVLVAVLTLHATAARAGDWLSDGEAAPIRVFDGKVDERAKEENLDLREKITIRRINPQCYSDWNNDPTALPYFFYQMERRMPGYPIYVNNDGIKLTGDEIFDYPIIYFTSHYAFTFSGEEIENLQRFLAQGGSLWLDDCTGSGPFMNSVPMQIQRIAPGAETRLMLMSDPRFNDIFRMIYSLSGLPDKREDFRKPFQATLINGRPAITFTPNDYGCDWEISSPPTSMNPLGNPAHDGPSTRVQAWREQVYQICINWMFYTLTH